jgi:putative SOS response-associated peptidase YedK
MCGRYYRRSDKQRIAEAFHLGVFEDLPLEVAPSYNIAPTTMQPVIRNNRDTGEREMVVMRWGMVPNFAKSLADFKGFSTINAKAETLLSKPLWRVPFHRRAAWSPPMVFTNGSGWMTKPSSPTPSHCEVRNHSPSAEYGTHGKTPRPKIGSRALASSPPIQTNSPRRFTTGCRSF